MFTTKLWWDTAKITDFDAANEIDPDAVAQGRGDREGKRESDRVLAWLGWLSG